MPSPASDVWGLGATLYLGACGYGPYEIGHRDDALEVRYRQLVSRPRPMPYFVPVDVHGAGPGRPPGAARGRSATTTPVMLCRTEKPVVALSRVRRRRHRSATGPTLRWPSGPWGRLDLG
ncbi:hypothetical protein H4N58_12380 [Mumia sp. ZJ1417]|uniref:hypothetical protein n=1 Tax=Mumia sp. ZJ1417 TaxID=2708082 RepID=UPI001420565C|nr:hypothetical protein [Mumia sp. ZJ1417]QMW65019.1 hypothetical protein H4N58_12380 [Mumia sp. ZJ1417]